MSAACVVLAVGFLGWALVLRQRLELVARAEHELRAPVTVVSLACERLRRAPATREVAEALETELHRLRAGLADLADARAGRRRVPAPAAVGLGRFAAGALAAWDPFLREAGRPARLDWRAGEAVTRADRGRLAQALGNLLANGAEHGSGPLELRGTRVPGGVRFEVRNGVRAGGAPPSSRSGRGLVIARQAAADIGGRLDVSRDESEVVATLELPLSQPPEAA